VTTQVANQDADHLNCLFSDSNLGIWLSTSPLSCSWAGTTADKAWRYLQIQLNRYDNAKVSRSYAEAVTDKIMARRLPLPSWLVRTEMERFPEDLIRKALHHGLVEAAVEWSSEHLRKVRMKLWDCSSIAGC
jgi:nuclear pore complex protein Nup160